MKSSEKPQKKTKARSKDANGIILARRGYEPQASDLIGDPQIRGRLWELIYAMASQGCYLGCTDHLSDRELHVWLHENWLQEQAADLPFEGQWNTRLSPVIACDEQEGTALWLRYYADEEERLQFAAEMLPPRESPRHDRDRFLPDAPGPIEAMEEEEEECDCLTDEDFGALEELKDDDDDDPLGLKAVDAAIGASYNDHDFGASSFDDQPVKEVWHRPLRVLQRHGVGLLPPDEHTDDTIGAALWELLHELACRGFFVLHTDHLADRELYAALWKDSLREPAKLPGRCSTAAWYHDFIGSGSEEDQQFFLRYYATDKQRAKAQRENPALELPPCETPIAKRDWRLPRGPF